MRALTPSESVSAYAHHPGTREERVLATFSEMGSPVMSGMITSVLASLPLFACNIVFFSLFGTFLWYMCVCVCVCVCV